MKSNQIKSNHIKTKQTLFQKTSNGDIQVLRNL